MSGIVVEKQETGSVIALAGVVDVACAEELKTALLQALGSEPVAALGDGSALRVSVTEVTYLDITAMQLLWAAARQARSAGAGFDVAGNIPGAMSSALAEAGFASFLCSEAAL